MINRFPTLRVGLFSLTLMGLLALQVSAQPLELMRLVAQYQNAARYGDLALAATQAAAALQQAKQTFGAEHPETLLVLLDLARLQRQIGALRLARAHYEQALALQERQYGNNAPELTPTLNALAEIALREQNYSAAVHYSQRLLTLDERYYGPHHPTVAADLERLAEAYRLDGQAGEAELAASRAERLYLQSPLADRLQQQTRSRKLEPAAPSSAQTVHLGDGDNSFTAVKVYYGTDRARSGDHRPTVFYGSERAELELGYVIVAIPPQHEYGQLESPYWSVLGVQGNPYEHVVTLDLRPLHVTDFQSDLQAHMAQRPSRDIFIFIHGYNVSFDTAARRTAQIAYDLNFEGTPILYSWPSRNGTSGYMADEASVQVSARKLRAFLEQILAQAQAERIHLLAHSMGNRALTEALEHLALRRGLPNPDTLADPLFDQIILTAPDIDTDLFVQLAPSFVPLARRVTLYASRNDLALNLSAELHGGLSRVGLADGAILRLEGVDTVDMSEVPTDFLGHSYYGDNNAAINDIFRLFWRGRSPPQRCGMSGTNGPQRAYWRYQPDDCADPLFRTAATLVKRQGDKAREHAIKRLSNAQKAEDESDADAWRKTLHYIEQLLRKQ